MPEACGVNQTRIVMNNASQAMTAEAIFVYSRDAYQSCFSYVSCLCGQGFTVLLH